VSFLNVGPWELTAVLIIAILLVGPKRMIQVARAIGRATSQMRNLSNEFLGTIQTEIDAVEEETRRALEGAVETGEESVTELQAAEQETRETLERIEQGRRQVTTSIRDELQAVEREAGQAVKDVLEGVEGIVKGERASKEEDGQEASRES
jgi:Sec-independent protein translocase protein TatA